MTLAYHRILPAMEILDCTDPFDFKPHIHDRYVVWINTGCDEHFSLKGNHHVLEQGSIGIFEPGLVHGNGPCVRESRHLRSFYIDATFFEDLGETYGRPGHLPDFHYQIRDREIWSALARFHAGMMGKTADLEADVVMLETFWGLIRRHGRAMGLEADGKEGSDHRVQRVVEYFHAHLDSPLRLKELAELAGCTEYHLIRLFRTHVGMPPHAYLLQLRLEKARGMILNGVTISEAALATGFSDQSHLNRKFKQRYGLTPKVYAG